MSDSLYVEWLREKSEITYLAMYKGDLLSIANALETKERALTAANARIAELEPDAERYRWLRLAGWIDDAIMESRCIYEREPLTLDAAIDAARGVK